MTTIDEIFGDTEEKMKKSLELPAGLLALIILLVEKGILLHDDMLRYRELSNEMQEALFDVTKSIMEIAIGADDGDKPRIKKAVEILIGVIDKLEKYETAISNEYKLSKLRELIRNYSEEHLDG